MTLDACIHALLNYGEEKDFFKPIDRPYIANRLLEVLGVHGFDHVPAVPYDGIEHLLDLTLDVCAQMGILKTNDVTHRDLLDAAIMGAMMPRPSEVLSTFNALYLKSPEVATQYFYAFSMDCNYIRKARTDKNLSWAYESEYGDIQITVNLSKPEKDIKAIEAERNAPVSGYPKCLLCRENEGYPGRINHPARQNLRMIPLMMDGKKWFMQYSPYLYYNEHAILLSEAHTPMQINASTFRKMLDFLKVVPHYFVGSNADLPIVGGSILSHDHFQGGRHTFPMALAKTTKTFYNDAFSEVEAHWIKWPMSVIRLKSHSPEAIIRASEHVLNVWRDYSDVTAQIIAYTNETPHNTITPIARVVSGVYEMDLVLRNNLTTEEYPMGLYHPHEEVHAIKKENIGLIEVMGLAILPPRLKSEMADMLRYLKGEEIGDSVHLPMLETLKNKSDLKNAQRLIQTAIGEKFLLALKHAGVFYGKEEAFEGFMQTLGWQEKGAKDED